MNNNGARVSPCYIPALILKYSVSPSGDLTINSVFIYRISVAFIVSFGIYVVYIFAIR